MELSGDDREALWSRVGGADRQVLRPPYTVKYFISKLLLDRRVIDFRSSPVGRFPMLILSGDAGGC